MIAHRHPQQEPRHAILARLADIEELAADRDRLLLVGLLGRCPRAVWAETMAALEARIGREAAR